MKYVSIDIETSGLDPERNQILSIGAVIEDTKNKLPKDEIPTFYRTIIHREITGSPFALNLNRDEISDISQYLEGNEKYTDSITFTTEEKVAQQFFDFLYLNGLGESDERWADQERRRVDDDYLPVFNSKTKAIYINVAGKNFGTFDKLFLEKLPWWKKLIRTRSRILDPGILFLNWESDDQIPGLDKCKELANIKGPVTHNALDDAWDVVELLRKFY